MSRYLKLIIANEFKASLIPALLEGEAAEKMEAEEENLKKELRLARKGIAELEEENS